MEREHLQNPDVNRGHEPRSAAILAAGSAGIPARSGYWRQDAARTRRLGSLRYAVHGEGTPPNFGRELGP